VKVRASQARVESGKGRSGYTSGNATKLHPQKLEKVGTLCSGEDCGGCNFVGSDPNKVGVRVGGNVKVGGDIVCLATVLTLSISWKTPRRFLLDKPLRSSQNCNAAGYLADGC